jgi:hypothetical protein
MQAQGYLATLSIAIGSCHDVHKLNGWQPLWQWLSLSTAKCHMPDAKQLGMMTKGPYQTWDVTARTATLGLRGLANSSEPLKHSLLGQHHVSNACGCTQIVEPCASGPSLKFSHVCINPWHIKRACECCGLLYICAYPGNPHSSRESPLAQMGVIQDPIHHLSVETVLHK